MKNFQPGSAKIISITVRLWKVNRFCLNRIWPSPAWRCPVISFFTQSALKKFPSKSAKNFSIKVRLKNKIQSPVDPDPVFNRDHDRAAFFQIKPWWKIFSQGLPKYFQSRSGCEKLTASASTPRAVSGVNTSVCLIFQLWCAQKISIKIC